MGIRRGSISTPVIADGLVFNVDAANRASCIPSSNTTIAYNTVDLSVSGSFNDHVAYLGPPTSASCFTFDGVDDYINFDQGSNFLPSAPFTIDIWVKQDNNGTCFFYSCSSPSMMAYYAADKIYFDGGGGDDQSYITFIRDTNWRNIIWVNPATSGADDDSYYIDGVSVAPAGTGGVSSQSDFLLGCRAIPTITHALTGAIGNVKIYNKALTAAEALHNYNALKGRFA